MGSAVSRSQATNLVKGAAAVLPSIHKTGLNFVVERNWRLLPTAEPTAPSAFPRQGRLTLPLPETTPATRLGRSGTNERFLG